MSELVIAVLQRRACIRQQTSKALLSLHQRPRADRFAIEIEKIEQKEYEGIGVARIRGQLDQTERGFPIRSNAAEFAIEICLLDRENRQCRGDGRVFVRPVLARARQQ